MKKTNHRLIWDLQPSGKGSYMVASFGKGLKASSLLTLKVALLEHKPEEFDGIFAIGRVWSSWSMVDFKITGRFLLLVIFMDSNRRIYLCTFSKIRLCFFLYIHVGEAGYKTM